MFALHTWSLSSNSITPTTIIATELITNVKIVNYLPHLCVSYTLHTWSYRDNFLVFSNVKIYVIKPNEV